MKPFWLSWYAHSPFTLESPWWVSGWAPSPYLRNPDADDVGVICAAVSAPDAALAMSFVRRAHDLRDVELKWRFVEQRPKGWSPYTERFPKADWMVWP